MSGRVTGMLRICKERGDGWIRLAGPQLEVRVLCGTRAGILISSRRIPKMKERLCV